MGYICAVRKTLAISFLFAVILPFIGVFCWLQLEKKMIRKQVKHQLMEKVDMHELVTFKFAVRDTSKLLGWEHKNEFEYQGEMYDVVRRNYQSDSVTYQLWWDHKETALNKQVDLLAQSIFNNHPDKQKTADYLSIVLHQLLVNEEIHSKKKPEIKSLNHSFAYFNNYSSIDKEANLPPPREFC